MEKPRKPRTAEAGAGNAKRPGKSAAPDPAPEARPPEVGGRDGPEPTRYGDWEKNGIASDF